MNKPVWLLTGLLLFPLASDAALGLPASAPDMLAGLVHEAKWIDERGIVISGVTGDGVFLGLVDQPVDRTHPDLVGKVPVNMQPDVHRGCSSGTEPSNCLVDRDYALGYKNHGTGTAGLLVGTGQNSDGTYRGIAPNATLVAATREWSGWDWFLRNYEEYPVAAVSNSWGWTSNESLFIGVGDPPPTPVEQATAAYRELDRLGALVVFAAGNYGGDGSESTTLLSSQLPFVVGVGATWLEGSSAWWDSSRGARRDAATWPDIVAPGANVTILVSPHGSDGYVHAGQYLIGSIGDSSASPPERQQENASLAVRGYTRSYGTSLSTPLVAGTAALMRQVNPNISPATMRLVLNETAEARWGDYATSGYYAGHGFLDVNRAVAVAHYLMLRPDSSVEEAAENATIGLVDGVPWLNPGILPIAEGTVSAAEGDGPEGDGRAPATDAAGATPSAAGQKAGAPLGPLGLLAIVAAALLMPRRRR